MVGCVGRYSRVSNRSDKSDILARSDKRSDKSQIYFGFGQKVRYFFHPRYMKKKFSFFNLFLRILPYKKSEIFELASLALS